MPSLEGGKKHLSAKKLGYRSIVGSRLDVIRGHSLKTSGGLTKKDLKYNKHGRIVSVKMSNRAKKEKRLEKAGFIARKGSFRLFKKSDGKKKSKK